MKLFALAMFLASTALAQLRAPVTGVVRDKTGALRPLVGVAGALIAGEPIATGVLSAAFSGTAGLAKTDGEVLVFDSERILERKPAPAGPAVFQFSKDGKPALACFPATGELWRWTSEGISVESGSEWPAQMDRIRRDGNQLVVSKTQARITAPDGEMEQMSDEWVVIHSSDGDWAIRIENGKEAVLRVPEVKE